LKSKQEQAFFLSFAGIVGGCAFRSGKSRGEEKEITPPAADDNKNTHRVCCAALRRGVKKERVGDEERARPPAAVQAMQPVAQTLKTPGCTTPSTQVASQKERKTGGWFESHHKRLPPLLIYGEAAGFVLMTFL